MLPGGGVGVYSYMKVEYMCHPEFENGGLREKPLTENEGDFGTKNNKEMYIFLKGGSFEAAQVGKVEQTKFMYIFEKWSL